MNHDIDNKVQSIWEKIIHTCNRVLHHADRYGFQFMMLPEPNVKDLANTLEHIVIPILDDIIKSGSISPESGIKIANISQYTLHLREIVLSIELEDEKRFNSAIASLSKEAMIF